MDIRRKKRRKKKKMEKKKTTHNNAVYQHGSIHETLPKDGDVIPVTGTLQI